MSKCMIQNVCEHCGEEWIDTKYVEACYTCGYRDMKAYDLTEESENCDHDYIDRISIADISNRISGE